MFVYVTILNGPTVKCEYIRLVCIDQQSNEYIRLLYMDQQSNVNILDYYKWTNSQIWIY